MRARCLHFVGGIPISRTNALTSGRSAFLHCSHNASDWRASEISTTRHHMPTLAERRDIMNKLLAKKLLGLDLTTADTKEIKRREALCALGLRG